MLGFVAIAAGVVVLDQATKLWVRARMSLGDSIPLVRGVMSITYARNTGAVFGILADRAALFVMAGVAAVILIVLFARQGVVRDVLFRAALGLQLGGACGNLVDRVALGYVVDFLDFHFWPVFNLADAAITLGAALVVFKILSSLKHGEEDVG